MALTDQRLRNCLMRARWPDFRDMPWPDLPSLDDLLMWAADQPDETLLGRANIGRLTLRQIRHMQPPLSRQMGDPIYGQPEEV